MLQSDQAREIANAAAIARKVLFRNRTIPPTPISTHLGLIVHAAMQAETSIHLALNATTKNLLERLGYRVETPEPLNDERCVRCRVSWEGPNQ